MHLIWTRQILSARADRPASESYVGLDRIAWIATVVACLIAVVVLILESYWGYAGVTLAVAISAGINLLPVKRRR
jgi:hypothetical protein